MKRNEKVQVSYKDPQGQAVKFEITLDVPENHKDAQELGVSREDWDGLAVTQYLTDKRNEARRAEVARVFGKAVGARSVVESYKAAGLTADEMLALIAEARSRKQKASA